MASSHLFAFCKDAICVAEDSSVAFYAPKNLKKFRVERLSGQRVAGLYGETTENGETQLHVIDAAANWFRLSLQRIELLSSSCIKWGIVLTKTTHEKPVLSARRLMVGLNNTDAERDQGILEAHFHEAGGMLHCVLLTLAGVHEATLRRTDAAVPRAVRIISFPGMMRGCTMATGRGTGLVLVGQRGDKWAQYSLFAERHQHQEQQQQQHETEKRQHAKQLGVPMGIQSLACSPNSDGAAIGGTRGELIVYPSVTANHHFAEHWHHTPLTALHFSVDGTSLFTGARESTLLIWNLSTYTFRKVGCSLGPIRAVLSTQSGEARVLLACAESTLATVNLLQLSVESAIEGVQWSVGESCTGLVVTQWMGQPAVILTGLPNVVRICDPLTQQALYSLHISSQMETIPNPPRHGIQHVGLLKDNSTIVTYEEFGRTSLPPLLRFWAYDADAKRHLETQTIYTPHRSRVLALCVDDTHRRVFTLSADTIKCWVEQRADPNAALQIGPGGWINQSSSATPSRLVSDMILAPDASLCFVADDSVHIYSIANLRPGEAWRRVVSLTQSASLSPLCDVHVLAEPRLVVARDASRVYMWSLETPLRAATVWAAADGEELTALCANGPSAVLAATTGGALWAIAKNGEARRVAAGVRVRRMRRLPGAEGSLAVVDEASGFRVLHLPTAREGLREATLDGDKSAPNSEHAETAPLQHYFHDVTGRNREDAEEEKGGDALNEAARASEATRWLKEVLNGSAYTAPPMETVLASYLKKRAGIPTI